MTEEERTFTEAEILAWIKEDQAWISSWTDFIHGQAAYVGFVNGFTEAIKRLKSRLDDQTT